MNNTIKLSKETLDAIDSPRDFFVSLRDNDHVSDLEIHADGPITVWRRRSRKYVFDQITDHARDAFVEKIEGEMQGTHRTEYAANYETSFRIALSDESRARVHALAEDKGMSIAVRIQPLRPPLPFECFGGEDERSTAIVTSVRELFSAHQGLIIFSGPVGHGKTTWQHAHYREINETPRTDGHVPHLYLAADPQEFYHVNKEAVFTQREIGHNALSYASVLKGALRVRHDILDIGEMRGDAETTDAIIKAMIMGSRGVTTAHTYTAAQAVNRFISSSKDFPREQMVELFKQLVIGIINVRLVPETNGELTLAVELANLLGMGGNIEALDDPSQFTSVLETTQNGANRTLEADLAELVRLQRITQETAFTACNNEDRMKKALIS